MFNQCYNMEAVNLNISSNQNDLFAHFKGKEEKAKKRNANLLKWGVLVYFLLLIFEGGLRKWVFPSLATPLLIIRDPVAMWLLYKAWVAGKMKFNFFITCMVIFGGIGFFTAMFFGHGNAFVALFGARTLMIHFPLMFVMGEVLDREDVVKLGRVVLWISIPMAVLTGLQFFSPQSALVNRGVGGDESGAGFAGALGYSRPPGTFSFTNGNSLFFEFVAAFLFFFWLSNERFNRLVLIASTLALIAAIPLSISRGLFFSVGVIFIFSLIAVSRKPKYFNRIVGASFGIVLLGAILSQAEFAQTALEAFTARFTNATESEGGVQGVLIDRYLGGMVNALANSSQIPYFGLGLGMGTNVGAMLLSGERRFLIAEGDWGRIIGEMGPLLGLLVVFVRLAFCFDISVKAYQRLSRADFLPWILLGFGLLIIPQGKWAQPTELGFSTLIGGLILASLHTKKTS